MKIWCIVKSDTAIKWRELLVVDQPSLLPCVAHNIFGGTPVYPNVAHILRKSQILKLRNETLSARISQLSPAHVPRRQTCWSPDAIRSA
jgi:hypothetical protein